MFKDINKDIDDIFNDLLEPERKPEKSEFIETPILRAQLVFKEAFERIKEAGLYKEAFICGGVVRFACSERRPRPATYSDIDVYCKTEEAFETLKNTMDNNRKYNLEFENDLSISYKKRLLSKPIQIIKPIKEGAIVATGDMEEILNNFDFSVIRTGMDIEHFARRVALVDKDFHKHENFKRLVLKNIHCPISSLHRCLKYHRKGYKLSSKEALKLFLDWEKRPQSYRDEIIEFFDKQFELDEETGQLKLGDQAEINRMYKKLRVD